MSISDNHNILHDIDFNSIILNKIRNCDSTKTKYLLLIDNENLERLNHIVQKYENHRKMVREKYKKKLDVHTKTAKTKDPISYKILSSF
jgi:hypothetical protein